MLIAHITDPHFGLDTRSLPGHPGPEKAFRRALQHVLAMDPAPEVLLLTGDLTDGGAKSDYLALRDVLHEMLPPPSAGGPRVWAILGNHDERGAARAVLGEWLGSAPELTTNPDSPACTYAQHGGLHFIGLDTLVPRKAHGELDDAQLDWLARTLDRCAGQPVLIFMHHPPLESGMAIMDAAGLLRGRDQLAQLVRAHGGVQLIIAGHLPRPVIGALGGAPVVVAPSCSHQLALSLHPSAGLSVRMEPPQIGIYRWTPEGGLACHFSHVQDYPGQLTPVLA